MKTIRDIDINNKTVLIRCDLNVPIKDGNIEDDNRIVKSLETIKYALKHAKHVIIMSHLGRIKNEEDKKKNSLKIVCDRLSDLLGEKVYFCTYDENIKNVVQNNKIVMLENVRYFDLDGKKESNNDEELSKFYASLADVYINDAFGVSHRRAASTTGVSKYLESAVGFLVEEEINKLSILLNNQEKPFCIILGGAKVSDKIGVIENLMEKVQTIEIGGAMANTFLKAKGYDIGSSKYEADKIEVAKQIMKDAFNKGVEIILPKDAKVAKIDEGVELTPETVESAEQKNVKLNVEGKGESLEGWQILDVGDTTLTYFADRLENAKTVVWNGPLGYTEVPKFAQGTEKIAKYISHTKAKCVIGGGDSVAAIQKIKKAAKQNGEDVKQEFSNIYLSTGGGASLEFLSGKDMPGFENIGE